MDVRLQNIEDNQKELIEDIKKLTLEIQKLQTICARMDNHISFVEATYDKFKYPLEVVKSKVETFFSRSITNSS